MVPNRRLSALLAAGLLTVAFTLGGFLVFLMLPVLLKIILVRHPIAETGQVIIGVGTAAVLLGLMFAWLGTFVRVWQWVAAFLFLARLSVAATLFIGLIDFHALTIDELWLILALYGMTVLLLTMSQILFPCWLGRCSGWQRLHPLFLVGFIFLGFALGAMIYPFAVEPFFIIDEQLLWLNIGLTCTGFLYVAVFFLLILMSRQPRAGVTDGQMA